MNLINVLSNQIFRRCPDERAALWLSGGIDGVTTGLAAEASGKVVTAYVAEVDGVTSLDRLKAEEIAWRLGWPLKIVRVSTAAITSDFMHLATHFRCRTKVQFEVGFPTMYLAAATDEDVILTGWNADDHYGNSGRFMRDISAFKRKAPSDAELKAFFDDHRRATYEAFDDPSSADTFWLATTICAEQGKRLIDPYTEPEARTFFAQFDHASLSRLNKPLVRDHILSFNPSLSDLDYLSGVQLQKGSGVEDAFARLLLDPRLNRFEKTYSTVSQLCQKWAKEVAAGKLPDVARSLAKPPPATVVQSEYGAYRSWHMSEVRSAASASSFNVISLFTGAGGSCLGHMMAGGRILFANEFIKAAGDTYQRNFPDTYLDRRDIRSLLNSPERLVELLKLVGTQPRCVEVLDGSPPCSEFSVAGKGMVDATVMKPYSDGSQRDISGLPLDYVQAARIIQPQVLLMENVPGLAGRGREILTAVVEALSTDYHIAWRVLNSAHFGVPQARRRLFILGVRKDVGKAIGLRDASLVGDVFPNPTVPGTTVRSALVDLPQTASDLRPWLRSARLSGLEDRIARLPKSPAKPIRLNQIAGDIDRDFTLTRCSWDRPAPTLTVTSQQPTGLAGAVHPDADRKFSLPELKRLFCVPDDFILTGTVAQAAERLCRMVPPPLTAAIAARIHERILQPYRKVTHG